MEGASLLETDFLSLQNAARFAFPLPPFKPSWFFGVLTIHNRSGQAQAVVAAARSLMSHADEQAKIASNLKDETEDSSLASKVSVLKS